ncbi:FmdB family zinc ribbon protein [Nocardia inohanensis]|uniref:FmdB family zinc ribbon protein n=1 Tax=Nocardia inohanensis TaxID=209246 RepID=UPI000A05A63C|nr:FmdB family zinc ribbon protein [Nocardia inohanensis]
MPTYSYACTECDNKFDIVQSFSDDALTTCPACSGKLRKLFNSVGIVFKGSGFYRTDSRNGSTSSEAAKPSSASDSTSTASAAPAASAPASSSSSTSAA